MNIIKAEELAEKKSVTKRAVYKNKSLPYDQDDGGARQYDLDNPEIQAWLSGKKTVQKKTVKKKTVNKTAKKKTVVKSKPQSGNNKLQEVSFKSELEEIPDEIKQLVDSGQLTFEHAMTMKKTVLEKIKIYETIKKTKVEAEIKRNDYISKKLVEIVLHKTFEIDRTQLIPLKDRLVIDLATIFGVTDDKIKVKAAEKLDEELWGYLLSVQKELNKFLKKHGGELIK